MLAVVAACIRGNDRLKICVHNRKLWAQILCQNSIMDDADQAVQTALGRRLPWAMPRLSIGMGGSTRPRPMKCALAGVQGAEPGWNGKRVNGAASRPLIV